MMSQLYSPTAWFLAALLSVATALGPQFHRHVGHACTAEAACVEHGEAHHACHADPAAHRSAGACTHSEHRDDDRPTSRNAGDVWQLQGRTSDTHPHDCAVCQFYSSAQWVAFEAAPLFLEAAAPAAVESPWFYLSSGVLSGFSPRGPPVIG